MQDRFIDSLQLIPKPLATTLVPLLHDKFSGHIDAATLASLCQQSNMTEQDVLLALLPLAAAMSRPAISQFFVGAIAKGASGDIYLGANLELPDIALFNSVHAEQSAISHAWLNGETRIVDIIVNYTPCGHCRQFINELVDGQEIRIHLPEQDTHKLAYYLPYAFGPSHLDVTEPLLTKQSIEFAYESSDPTVIEALDQAGLSYAPYTNSYAAVVLETYDGKTYCGRYAENAAYNPSMMPMQMALSTLARHNRQYDEIKRAILVESAMGKISIVAATQDALHAVAGHIELEHFVVEPVKS